MIFIGTFLFQSWRAYTRLLVKIQPLNGN